MKHPTKDLDVAFADAFKKHLKPYPKEIKQLIDKGYSAKQAVNLVFTKRKIRQTILKLIMINIAKAIKIGNKNA
jgi:hypothetical protein